jgi:RNA-directed DNA polymerase
MREQLAARLQDCGLEMHPEKTRIVYCRDSRRTRDHENVQFDVLGYTFRPRRVASRYGGHFTGFTPAVSPKAMAAMRESMRRQRLFKHSEQALEQLAAVLAPRVRGWMAYYCRFRGSEFQPIADHIDESIVRRAMKKYKRLRGHKRRAFAWLDRVKRGFPGLFPHWCGRGDFAVGATGAR